MVIVFILIRMIFTAVPVRIVTTLYAGKTLIVTDQVGPAVSLGTLSVEQSRRKPEFA